MNSRTVYLYPFVGFLVLSQFISNVSQAATRYTTIDRPLYLQYEYQLIMNDSISVFIMNQPYDAEDISQIESDIVFKRLVTYNRTKNIAEENVAILVKPGWQFQTNPELIHNPSLYIYGYFKNGDIIGVNRTYASKQLILDKDYHGDKSEWIAAYTYDAYVIYAPSPKLSIYGGRTSRNYGIPNEYSLFLSNNPYPYDHFGFSTSGDMFQYSWYFGRLNDMEGLDDQGLTIPLGESIIVKRFLSFQRIDFKVNNRIQIGISEAALYGGPGQSQVSAYLNPINFYYLSQRNQRIQMNGSWQINLFYFKPHEYAFYLEFYIDDFIINNEDGIDDRAKHPDRLAIMSKLSVPDLGKAKSLTTLRYVRIWNETYVTYRNYENWLYFNKGLGFPKRSFESLKLERSYLGSDKWMSTISFEGWRHGDRSLFATLADERNVPFPSGSVSEGVISSGNLKYIRENIDINIEMLLSITFEKDGPRIDKRIIGGGFNYRFQNN
jgi:hypothetical protein